MQRVLMPKGIIVEEMRGLAETGVLTNFVQQEAGFNRILVGEKQCGFAKWTLTAQQTASPGRKQKYSKTVLLGIKESRHKKADGTEAAEGFEFVQARPQQVEIITCIL